MLDVLTTHPIQTECLFGRRSLASRGRIPINVSFLSDNGHVARQHPSSGQDVSWEIDLLAPSEVFLLDQPNRCFGRSVSLKTSESAPERMARQWLQGWQVAAYWQAPGQEMELSLSGATNLRSSESAVLHKVESRALSTLFDRIDWFLYIGQANRQSYLSRGVSANRRSPAAVHHKSSNVSGEQMQLAEHTVLRADR